MTTFDIIHTPGQWQDRDGNYILEQHLLLMDRFPLPEDISVKQQQTEKENYGS
jgi:hypothetical protein